MFLLRLLLTPRNKEKQLLKDSLPWYLPKDRGFLWRPPCLYADVVQLVRTAVFQTVGHGFESHPCRGEFEKCVKCIWFYIEKCETMEKLIKYINEYGKTGNCWPFQTCRIEPATDYASSYLVLSRDDSRVWDWKDWFLEVPRLISKEYGFIWWLVENDKIDKKKLDEAERRPMYVTDDMFSLYKVDECIIMLLSISDSPIEDLINYLN